MRTVASFMSIMALAVITVQPLLGQGGGQAPGRGEGGGRGQGGGVPGGRGQGGPPPAANLPTAPTAVTLPTLSAEITGPGAMFDSAPSLPAGQGLSHFRY